jgi:HEAT repeat protein
VVGIDTDHRAARRELGYEKVGGEWVTGDDAQRSKGFVLCAGKWMLPAEADRLMRAGLMEQPKANEEHRRRAEELVAAMLDDDAEVRRLATSQLAELPDAALVRPLEKALFAPDPAVRIAAVKTLSRIGDRVALPWLIRSSMFDAKPEVRNAAFRAVRSFRDEDVFFPYARAMYSASPKARIMAAQVLADLDDLRGVDVILRRISFGLGASPRVNLMVGAQTSYIRDFDVEIAQAAAIGDPIVGTIRDGIILDFKILGGYGESWVVEQRRAFAGALANLTGRDYGEDWVKYDKYATEQQYPRVRVQ